MDSKSFMAPILYEHNHNNNHSDSNFHPSVNLLSVSSVSSSLSRDNNEQSSTTSFKGVAVTLALSAPKWFHRRYVVMIQNVLMNIPKDWAVQIMINQPWWEQEIMLHHSPGITQLLQLHSSRIILTPLPQEFIKQQQHHGRQYKPKQIMTTTWFWEHVVADRVLIFSGNGVLCSNAKQRLHQFDSNIVFMGVAPPQHHNNNNNKKDYHGGDTSTHSLRDRRTMLTILQDYYQRRHNNNNNNNNNDTNQPLDFHESEGEFFIQQMMIMMQQQPPSHSFRIATYQESLLFGSMEPLLDNSTTSSSSLLRSDYEQMGPPLIVSGTQAHLSFTVRETLLNLCPELKVIFPSLHEPHCFGAHPQPEPCAASICALRQPLPSSGC